MAKQVLEINNFAGGLNAYSDARDIKDTEFVQNWNALVSKAGIIKVAGMCKNYIDTEYFQSYSSNFQQGYGLFQFTVDYSISEIGGNFSVGTTTGTRAGSNSTTAHSLENKPSVLTSDDAYNGMIMFIFEGAGIGESRIITAFDKDTRVLTTEAFATTLNTTSKYIIFPWKVDGSNWAGKDEIVKKDFITNGTNAKMLQALYNNYTNDYYIFSSRAVVDGSGSILDEQSKNFGYIEYGQDLTLIPGTEYKLSFDCAALNKFRPLVSKGSTDASGTSYGDKVPWVELYSTTVADTQGSIKSIDATGVSTSAAWTNAQTYYNIEPVSSTGNGTGASFNIVTSTTSSSGDTATFHFVNRGSGYVVDEELTFSDPAGSGRTATIVIASINITGLSLQESFEGTQWKSGIVGNNATSKYILNHNNNYISNGDFTNGTTGWTSGSKVTAAEESSSSLRYDSHDGTLSVSKSSVATTHLIEPWNNSWNEYIYQDVTLDENTKYHLNFLYDLASGSGGMHVCVYDTTNSQVLIHPQNSMKSPTRGVDDSVNYAFGAGNTMWVADEDLNDMDYNSFIVGNAPLNSTTTTCTIRIGFSPTMATRTLRLGVVSLYKAHNDLVTMNFNSGSTTHPGNPFSENIHSFGNYNMTFKVPENYSKVSTWVLRLHAGQFSARTSSDYSNIQQEVYFDNIRLSSEPGAIISTNTGDKDTVTVLTNNADNNTDISFHSQKSQSWMPNLIRWNGLKSQPCFDYINGMLKISDGNFNNDNNNKLLYYAGKENTNGSSELGWVVRDEALQNPPTCSVSSINDSEILTSYVNGVNELNERYIQTTTIPGAAGAPDLTITTKQLGNYDGTSGVRKNANSVASAFGQNDPQGFVLRYWFDKRYSPTVGVDPIRHGSDGTGQIMIPRYNITPGGSQASAWYANNIESNNYTGGGGYNNNIAGTLPTGEGNLETGDTGDSMLDDFTTTSTTENSVAINYHGHGIREHNSFNELFEETQNKEIGIPSDVLKKIDSINPNAGNIAKIEIEFQYQSKGMHNDGYIRAPKFSLSASKAASTVIDGDVDNTNINWVPNTGIDQNVSQVKTYGTNGAHARTTLTADTYQAPTDSGECVNFTYTAAAHEAYMVATFKDSFSFNDGEITKDDKIFLNLTEMLTDTQMVTNFFGNDNSSAYGGEGNQRFWDSLTCNTDGGYGINTYNREHRVNMYRTGSKYHATYSRFLIHKLNIYYYNKEGTILDETTSSDLPGANAKVLFQWDNPIKEGSLSWGERSFRLATSSVNIFDEESSINELSDIIGGVGDPTDEFPNGLPVILIGYAPNVSVRLEESHFNNPYIKKTKFYMKDENSEIHYLQFYIDHVTGLMHSTTSGITASSSYNQSEKCYDWILERDNFLNFNEVNSYESETFVSQDDGKNVSELRCRYKTSVIANNRLYVGNIQQNGRIYGDRMLKSPIGKYNILPKSNFIDVAINDGDEITALAYYKDKILQYKKRKVFVINVSGDFEFLEDTFENVGVSQQSCVTKTPYGIAWANKSGCYLYDGNKLTNLIENKIPVYQTTGYVNNYWLVGDNVPSIGYSQKDDILLIKFTSNSQSSLATPDSATYHFPTQSWMFALKSFNDMSLSETGQISNIITDEKGDLLVYRNAIHVSDNPVFDGIKKYNYEPYAQNNNLQITTATGVKVFTFTTKDFTFGNLSARKKIYKVYITYRTTSGNNSYMIAHTGINGSSLTTSTPFSASKSNFFGTSTACYHSSNGLLDTGGDWKTAELNFTTPSNYNNINSFQLSFTAATPDPGFEINDISIVFKTKRIK